MKKLLVLTLLAGAFLFSGCGSDKSTQVPTPADDAPPLAPTGLTCQVDNSLIAVLTWTRNTEPDVAGYRVYVYDPNPRRNGSYVLQNTDELLTEARWTCPIQYDQALWVRLTAVDAAGNESLPYGPTKVTAEPPPAPPAGPPPIIKPPPPIGNPHNGSDGRTDGSGTDGNG
jgi:hypothetical protein